MPAEVITLPVFASKNIKPEKGQSVVSTVSRASNLWHKQLSPFTIGPCELYGGYVSKNVENAWQYAKVYGGYSMATSPVVPTLSYFRWAQKGWEQDKAVRYPMGKGAKPLYSWWGQNALDYVMARKVIYGPLYAEAVQKTEAWKLLKKEYKTQKKLVLLDFDVRDTRATNETMTEVLNNPHKKMGHAFVLKMLLERDKALDQMELR